MSTTVLTLVLPSSKNVLKWYEEGLRRRVHLINVTIIHSLRCIWQQNWSHNKINNDFAVEYPTIKVWQSYTLLYLWQFSFARINILTHLQRWLKLTHLLHERTVKTSVSIWHTAFYCAYRAILHISVYKQRK